MVATLKSSVGKMNELLARLAPHSGARIQPSVAKPLQPIVEAAIASASRGRAVTIAGDPTAGPRSMRRALTTGPVPHHPECGRKQAAKTAPARR